MLKKLTITAIVALGTYLLLMSPILIGAYFTLPSNNENPADALSIQLSQLENKPSILLSDIAPFEWEQACFLGPYRTLSDTLNSDIREDDVELDDGVYHLAFVLPNKRSVAIKIPRAFYEKNHQLGCVSFAQKNQTILYNHKD